MTDWTIDASAIVTLRVAACDEYEARDLVRSYRGIEFGSGIADRITSTVDRRGTSGDVTLTCVSTRAIWDVLEAYDHEGCEIGVDGHPDDGKLVDALLEGRSLARALAAYRRTRSLADADKLAEALDVVMYCPPETIDRYEEPGDVRFVSTQSRTAPESVERSSGEEHAVDELRGESTVIAGPEVAELRRLVWAWRGTCDGDNGDSEHDAAWDLASAVCIAIGLSVDEVLEGVPAVDL